jgi:hypothetical protein
MKARLMSSGGLVCIMEEDPGIPLGSLVEFMGHRFWVYSGEVERSDDTRTQDQIVYHGQMFGEASEVIKLKGIR